ncbi:MAG: hypothetical protein LBV79_05010 [Candidatus Adiutrix sp.]|nr:hypothetical protein [Candidatus Adiutrix sp.]
MAGITASRHKPHMLLRAGMFNETVLAYMKMSLKSKPAQAEQPWEVWRIVAIQPQAVNRAATNSDWIICRRRRRAKNSRSLERSEFLMAGADSARTAVGWPYSEKKPAAGSGFGAMDGFALPGSNAFRVRGDFLLPVFQLFGRVGILTDITNQ